MWLCLTCIVLCPPSRCLRALCVWIFPDETPRPKSISAFPPPILRLILLFFFCLFVFGLLLPFIQSHVPNFRRNACLKPSLLLAVSCGHWEDGHFVKTPWRLLSLFIIQSGFWPQRSRPKLEHMNTPGFKTLVTFPKRPLHGLVMDVRPKRSASKSLVSHKWCQSGVQITPAPMKTDK